MEENKIEKYFASDNWHHETGELVNDDFNDWYRELIRKYKTSYINALRLPLSLCQDEFSKLLLVKRVSKTCFEAHKYESDNDKFRIIRENYKGADGYRLKAIKSLKELDKISDYPELLLSLQTAIANIENKGVKFNEDSRINSPDLLFQTIFKELREVLTWGIPGHKSGNFIHRYRIGPLYYPTPKDSSKAPSIESMLAFNLVLLFRIHTKQRLEVIRPGIKMPTDGSPCFDNVSDLVSLITNSEWTAENVIKAVDKLVEKGVGLGEWPKNNNI